MRAVVVVVAVEGAASRQEDNISTMTIFQVLQYFKDKNNSSVTIFQG